MQNSFRKLVFCTLLFFNISSHSAIYWSNQKNQPCQRPKVRDTHTEETNIELEHRVLSFLDSDSTPRQLSGKDFVWVQKEDYLIYNLNPQTSTNSLLVIKNNQTIRDPKTRELLTNQNYISDPQRHNWFTQKHTGANNDTILRIQPQGQFNIIDKEAIIRVQNPSNDKVCISIIQFKSL